mmetsp:Transcript_45358/g.84596  ORF Transcript_45358/g.84596 Transcript_45358/m.84596 type:complete len:81 (-) Transcript_45358:196-438(-)
MDTALLFVLIAIPSAIVLSVISVFLMRKLKAKTTPTTTTRVSSRGSRVSAFAEDGDANVGTGGGAAARYSVGNGAISNEG